jgi:Zn-finger nucleic acid-binding protein
MAKSAITETEVLDYLASLEQTPSHANDQLVPHGERQCPLCNQKMTIELSYGISFDVCGDHGVWLDRGELDAIIARIRRGERISRTQAIREARKAGLHEGNRIAGPIMSLFLLMGDD